MHALSLYFILTIALTFAIAAPSVTRLSKRTDPYFPDSPPSCQICAPAWPSLSSCAGAAVVFANVSEVLYDPAAFIDVIKCSCTDTFESTFPQCVDCFQMTNQTDVLDTPDLPAVVSGMRQVCSFASTLFGGVASTNRELPSETPITPTPNSAAGRPTGLIAPGLFPTLILGLGGAILGVLLVL